MKKVFKTTRGYLRKCFFGGFLNKKKIMNDGKFIKEINEALKKLEVMGWHEMVEIDCENLINNLGFYYQRN